VITLKDCTAATSPEGQDAATAGTFGPGASPPLEPGGPGVVHPCFRDCNVPGVAGLAARPIVSPGFRDLPPFAPGYPPGSANDVQHPHDQDRVPRPPGVTPSAGTAPLCHGHLPLTISVVVRRICLASDPTPSTLLIARECVLCVSRI